MFFKFLIIVITRKPSLDTLKSNKFKAFAAILLLYCAIVNKQIKICSIKNAKKILH